MAGLTDCTRAAIYCGGDALPTSTDVDNRGSIDYWARDADAASGAGLTCAQLVPKKAVEIRRFRMRQTLLAAAIAECSNSAGVLISAAPAWFLSPG
jgi:hypothetical protein